MAMGVGLWLSAAYTSAFAQAQNSALSTAAVTTPEPVMRQRLATKLNGPELSLGELLASLADRWKVSVPETIGIYSASIIHPPTRRIHPAVVVMDEARMQQLVLPSIKQRELRSPIELRFEPGIKGSPAEVGMTFAQVEKLTHSLRNISGYQNLAFDERGYLMLGQRVAGGSELARVLLRTAVESSEVFEIEGFEGSDTIAFGAFLSTQFNSVERGAVAYNRIQLDFKDFAELRSGPVLQKAFDPGFVFLHELAHGVWELPDEGNNGLGECEAFINQIRRQLGLPERVRYHYHVRGVANGGELGEMLFVEQDKEGRRRLLKLIWNNHAVNKPAKTEAKDNPGTFSK